MWTEQFGIGRNWLASALTRVWRGEVAPSLDLVALLGGTFNNAISCKRMAIVDEIHIGSNQSLFTMAARLRQIMTEEIRVINPKYGKMTSEYNTTRWLIFSNHDDALPIPEDDRRFEVVKNPSQVQSEDYYSKLYKALDDHDFIAGICYFLATRDISNFNAGARPIMTEAKKQAIKATVGEVEREVKEIIASWKKAGIQMFCASDLMRIISPGENEKRAMSHIYKRIGVLRVHDNKQRIISGGIQERLYAIDEAALKVLSDQNAYEEAKKRILKERLTDGLFFVGEGPF